ncbi:MAG: elongation factor G [Planctomycetota bacterium]
MATTTTAGTQPTSTHDLRNLALIGPAGAGKTTLAESLLAAAGVIGQAGSVEDRNTVADHTPEEQDHGHSLHACLLHLDHEGRHINLIDTPGLGDFMGQAVAAMPAVETVACVIDPHAGFDVVARRLMQIAAERKLCRMVIVNKIDAHGFDAAATVDMIQQHLGKTALPINLPADGGSQVVDCFFNPDGDSDLGPVADAHTRIVEQVVEVDEDLMAAYLEQGDVAPEQLHEPFEKALREGHLVPICFVAARPHADHEHPVGVDELLRVIDELAPDPTEGNPRPFYKDAAPDDEMHASLEASDHVMAHVFQVTNDAYAGKLAAFRVHQGTVTPQTQLFIDDRREGESKKPFKVGHLFKVQGGQRVEVDRAIPGDLVAVAKVEDVHFDAVLHDSHDEDGIHLRPLRFPAPMVGLAITPTKRGDESKLATALARFQDEDPCFKVTHDSQQTVIHGLGELHLRVMLEQLKDRYHVEVETAPPTIAYRETIAGKAEGHHRHKKQTGGAGQFGEVYLRIEPLPRDAGFEFKNGTYGGSIPQQFMPAIEKGVRQVLEEGAIAGYPMQDLRVEVYDGKHHPVDSKEVAFITAAKRAFVEAVQKAKPTLLEPMVAMEVTLPEAQLGAVTGDLTGKRGRILTTDTLPGEMCLIKAIVPLAELTQYASQLKSVTGGQGSFTMELDHYEPVPSHVAQSLMVEPKHDDG